MTRQQINSYANPADFNAASQRVANAGWHISSVTWAHDQMVVIYEMEQHVARRIGGILAAIVFGFAALQMVTLQSVGGNSVAEFFYHGVGYLSAALAVLSLAWGLDD